MNAHENEPNKHNIAPGTRSTAAWFNSRPIPVFIIAFLCILQFMGITSALAYHWETYVELLSTGTISIFGFVTGLLYPFVVFVAGILLLLMRKSAIYAFALYLVWGITKVFLDKGEFQAYSSLAIVFGILVYCLRLKQMGKLK